MIITFGNTPRRHASIKDSLKKMEERGKKGKGKRHLVQYIAVILLSGGSQLGSMGDLGDSSVRSES